MVNLGEIDEKNRVRFDRVEGSLANALQNKHDGVMSNNTLQISILRPAVAQAGVGRGEVDEHRERECQGQ